VGCKGHAGGGAYDWGGIVKHDEMIGVRGRVL
jgi:hypothetical protein